MPVKSGGDLALGLMVAVGVVMSAIAIISMVRTGLLGINVRRKHQDNQVTRLR